MATAKDIILKPIAAKQANELVKRVHYSKKTFAGSKIHVGVFLNGKLEGAMQFGSPLDRRKLIGLVKGTGWNEFIELNRMAFTVALPRNSESRAIAIAMKLLKKHAPQLKWVVSFADATRCGDGAIYRASGFVLTGIRENISIVRMPDGSEVTDLLIKEKYSKITGSYSLAKALKYFDATPNKGYQLRYIYFLDPEMRSHLTVPELPFSKIEELGAKMYRGKRAAEASD